MSRSDRLASGQLIDLSAQFDRLPESIGFAAPVAFTDDAYAAAVWPIDDESGRFIELEALGENARDRAARMLRAYIHTVGKRPARLMTDGISIALPVVIARDDVREVALSIRCEPDDDGTPCLTFDLIR